MTDQTDTPLEIPRLIITPSTPTDDPPIPKMGRGRRPTLFRSQSLLDQIDTVPIPVHNLTTTTTRRSKSRTEKEGKYHHHLTPLLAVQASTNRQTRPGRGTAASLVLVLLALVLVISSALLSPETITSLLHSETEWMASDRVEMWTPVAQTPIVDHAAHQSGHYEEEDETSDSHSTSTSTAIGSEEPLSRDPRLEHTDTNLEIEHHTASGPVLTNDAWRSYLRRKEQVTGQAGPTAHLEAWDFH